MRGADLAGKLRYQPGGKLPAIFSATGGRGGPSGRRMTRVVLQGGSVFDGSGSPPAIADVVIEDGRIVDVGPGLDGDEAADCAGQSVVPGFIDSHVHFMLNGQLDPMYWCAGRSR